VYIGRELEGTVGGGRKEGNVRMSLQELGIVKGSKGSIAV
jgi:hypothetical protein